MAQTTPYVGLLKHPKTGIYWYRRGVPLSARLIIGKREINQTLRTRDLKQAIVSWGPVHAAWTATLDEAVKGDRRRYPDTALDRMAAEFTRPNRYIDRTRRADQIESELDLWIVRDPNHYALDLPPSPPLAKADRDYLRAAVFAIYVDRTAGEAAVARTQATAAMETEARLRRQSGEPDPTRLTALYALWAKSTRPQTAAEAKTAVDAFVAVNGDLPLTAYTRKQHGHAFVDYLVASSSDAARATLEKKLALVRAVFGTGVERDWIEVNPLAGLAIRANLKPAASRKEGWTLADLNRLFASPVFAAGARPQGGGGEAAYWLPVLGLYTGARQSELAQLDVADVIPLKGVWSIRLQGGDGKRFKTESSIRDIPLHAALLDLGFLDFLASEQGGGRLFPKLKADVHGRAGGIWSKFFGRYRKDTGIVGEWSDFHALRHNWKTAARAAGMDNGAIDYVCGHSAANVGATYGTWAIPTLKSAIDKISFDEGDARLAIPKWMAPTRMSVA